MKNLKKGRRIYRPKLCEYKNEDEDNSLNILSDKKNNFGLDRAPVSDDTIIFDVNRSMSGLMKKITDTHIDRDRIFWVQYKISGSEWYCKLHLQKYHHQMCYISGMKRQ